LSYDSKHRSVYGYLDAVAITPLAQDCYKIIAWGGRIRLHVFEHFGVGQQFETIFKHKPIIIMPSCFLLP